MTKIFIIHQKPVQDVASNHVDMSVIAHQMLALTDANRLHTMTIDELNEGCAEIERELPLFRIAWETVRCCYVLIPRVA